MDELSDWGAVDTLTTRFDYLLSLRGSPVIDASPSAAKQLADALDAVAAARTDVVNRIASRAGVGSTA